MLLLLSFERTTRPPRLASVSRRATRSRPPLSLAAISTVSPPIGHHYQPASRLGMA